MKFIINGGRILKGAISVLGSKNAATPIISATILTKRPCVISNVPRIGDVITLLSILESMGSEISWLDDSTLRIVNRDIDAQKIDIHLVRKIRSSMLLVGPMLARFGSFAIGTPGGCHIGARSLDTHLEAFKSLGVKITYDKTRDIYYMRRETNKHAENIVLKEFSVTATENLLMLIAVMPFLKIELAAVEPHVQDLGNFLKVLGVQIDGLGTHWLEIRGSKKIINGKKEVRYSIISDPIEAGTFMVLGALTGEKLIIKRAPLKYLTAPIYKIKEFGVSLEIKNGDIIINRDISKFQGTKIQTLPYPGFPTDLQAPFGVLATQSKGETLIFDTLYEGRLRYIKELIKMGARAKILDSHRALINGRTPLRGSVVRSLDLRAGATLVIAALLAKGKSILHDVEQIDRGYSILEERLQSLGADIERIK